MSQGADTHLNRPGFLAHTACNRELISAPCASAFAIVKMRFSPLVLIAATKQRTWDSALSRIPCHWMIGNERDGIFAGESKFLFKLRLRSSSAAP